MPPSNEMRTSRPSALERRMSSTRELVSNPSFSRLTSSGQVEHLARLKEESRQLTFATPSVIAGRYSVVVPFQEGKSMSAVYLTKDTEMDDLVVVKMVSDISPEPSAIAIRREIRALSTIRHPNVVGLRGHGCWEGREYIVLEYVRGSDLYLLLGDYRGLPWKNVRSIVLQLCDALQEIHRNRIIHKDIKPENVIITRMDDLKPTLLDFGLARFMDVDPDHELAHIPGLVAGTFPYMAPETFKINDYDYRVDIYSLGILMYEMLSGRNPFDGDNIPAVVDRIREHTPDPPSTWTPLPACVDDIVMRALSKDPEERFATIVAMRQAIESCRK